MNISGAEKVILYNVDTEENLTFSKISPESKYLKQALHEQDLDGNLIHTEDKFNLTLVLFDEVDAASLQTSIEAGDKFRIEVIGLGEFINWNKPSKLIFDDEFKFQARQKNRVTIRLQAKGSDLDIGREQFFELLAEGSVIPNFVGLNTGTGGINAKATAPGSVGNAGSITWMGKNMETVFLETGE